MLISLRLWYHIEHTVMKYTYHPHHKVKRDTLIDHLALIAGIVSPAATLPQIYLTYSTASSAGVSFFMWTAYNVVSVILLLYGIKHKLKPIIISQALWLVVQTPMMIAVFVFP